MIYRNIKTGAEIITRSAISAPDYELVPDKAAKVAPKEAPKKEPPKEELPKEEPVKKTAPKKGTAPKKRGTKK